MSFLAGPLATIRKAFASEPEPVAKAAAGGSDLISPIGDSAVYDAISGNRQSAGPSVSDLDTYWMLYAKHVWVSTCVDLIAEAVASEGFQVAPVEGASSRPAGDNEDPRIGQISQFFENATPGSTFEQLRLAGAVDVRVFGYALWRKKRASANGKPLFLERIDPRLAKPVLTPDRKRVDCWMLKVSDNQLEKRERIDAKDVIFFRMGGGDPIFGSPSPLESLDLTISQDWSIRKHRIAFSRNGGVKGRVIQIDTATEDDAKRITKRLREAKTGVENAFRDLVLPGRGVSIVSAGAEQGKQDFDFRGGSADLRDEIFAKYHVPPGKVFMQAGALGQAGKEQDDDTFQRDAVLPVERMMYAALTIDLLANEFGIDDLKLVPKRLSQIRFDRFEAASQVVTFGGTGNEARQLAGLPPIEGLDEPLFLGSKQPLVAVEATDEGDQEGDGNVPTLDDQDDEAEETGAKNKPKVTPKPKPTGVQKADARFRRRRGR